MKTLLSYILALTIILGGGMKMQSTDFTDEGTSTNIDYDNDGVNADEPMVLKKGDSQRTQGVLGQELDKVAGFHGYDDGIVAGIIAGFHGYDRETYLA